MSDKNNGKKHGNRPFSGNGAMDLGDLMGLDQAPETPVSSNNADPAIKGSQHRPIQAHGAPDLWMRTPQQYPGVLENFRAFKNKLAALKDKEDARVFLLTGSENKVGVSTVVFNLGLVMGWDLADQRILIADTNFFNPSLHKAFGLSSTPGLTDFLVGETTMDQVICPSGLPNMDVVPIGQTDRRIPSPFFLAEFSRFVDAVRKSYDFVFFDSSPGLRSSETRSIALKADGVIIVAEAGHTRWQVVAELKRQLEDEGAIIAGSFLNKRQFFIPKWLYQFV